MVTMNFWKALRFSESQPNRTRPRRTALSQSASTRQGFAERLESRWMLADDHGNDPQAATEVNLPTLIEGRFDAEDDVDWFRVRVPAGTMLHLTSFQLPSVEAQVVVTSISNDYQNLPLIWGAETTENQEVVFGLRSKNRVVGNYAARLAIFPDDYGSSPETATTIPTDKWIDGQLNDAKDKDVMAVELGTGQALLANSFSTIKIRLLDANGKTLATSQRLSIDQAYVTWTNFGPSSKTYLEVTTDSGFAGTYALRATTLADEAPNDASSARLVTSATVTGTLQTIDTDFYRLALKAGTSYALEVDRLPPWISWALISADGTTVLSDRYAWTSVTDETVYVRLINESVDSVSYRFTVSTFADDYGSSPSTATRIAPVAIQSLPTTVTGVLENIYDADFFRLDVPLGKRYRIEFNGQARASRPFTLESLPEWITYQNGEPFFIVVSDGFSAGSYSLAVSMYNDELPGEDPRTITSPGIIRSNFDFPGDTDTLTLKVLANRQYRLNGPNYQLLSSTTAWSLEGGVLTAAADGEVTFLLSGPTVGPYDFIFELLAAEETWDHADQQSGAKEIRPGQTVYGIADLRFDEDWFYFDAEAGWYYREVTTSSPIVRYVGAGGDTLAVNENGYLRVDQTQRVWIFAGHSQGYSLTVVGSTNDPSAPNNPPILLTNPSSHTVSAWTQVNAVSFELAPTQQEWTIWEMTSPNARLSIDGFTLLETPGHTLFATSSEARGKRLKAWSDQPTPFTLRSIPDTIGHSRTTATLLPVGTPISTYTHGSFDWYRLPVRRGQGYSIHSDLELFEAKANSPDETYRGRSFQYLAEEDGELLLMAPATSVGVPYQVYVQMIPTVGVREVVRGLTSSVNEVAYYMVHLEANQLVRAEELSGRQGIEMGWWSQETGLSGNQPTIAAFVTKETKQYMLGIYSAEPGAHVIRIVAEPQSPVSLSMETASTVRMNSIHGAHIQAGEEHWYALPAGTPSRFRIQSSLAVSVWSNNNYDELIRRDPPGVVFPNHDGRLAYIRIPSRIGTSYTFWVEQELDLYNSIADAGPLAVPSTATGNLFNDGTNLDYFRVEMVQGKRYEFMLQYAASSGPPFRIVEPKPDGSNTVLYRAEWPASARRTSMQVFWVAPASKTYYVIIGGAQRAVSEYKISVRESNERPNITSSEAITISSDLIAGTFEDTLTPLWYRLNVKANQIYRIASTLASGRSPRVELYKLDGQSLLADITSDSWRADRDEDFLMKLSPRSSSLVEPFELQILTTPDPGATEAQNATLITLGQPLTDMVSSTDVDWWRFVGNAGQELELSLETFDITTQATVFDPRTLKDLFRFGMSNVKTRWTPSKTAEYLVRLTTDAPLALPYTLQFASSPIRPTEPAEFLPVAIHSEWRGRLQPGADIIGYRLDGVANHSYQLTLQGILPSQIRVMDRSTGESIPFTIGERMTEIVWTASRDGEQRIVVNDFSGKTFDFGLALTVGDQQGDDFATAGELPPDVASIHALEYRLDVDAFLLDAVAGQAIRLTCESLTPLDAGVALSVSDANERLVAGMIPPNQPLVIQWIPDETERLIVHINPSLTGLGAYRLTFDTPAGDTNLDGHFNSADLVRVFQAGEYEDEVFANSSWDEGDWNGDKEFNSSDLIAAFINGEYEE